MRSASGRPACGSSSGSIARKSPIGLGLASRFAFVAAPLRTARIDAATPAFSDSTASLIGIEMMRVGRAFDFRRQTRAFVADEHRRRLAQIARRALPRGRSPRAELAA